MSVIESLDRFIERYLQQLSPPPEPFDPQWRSASEIGEPFTDADGEPCIHWRPIRRDHVAPAAPTPEKPASDDSAAAEPAADEHAGDLFAGLARALELAIHPDIAAYYQRYWSAGLHARAPDGPVSLILLWNADDAERLIENLIGHAIAKRRSRQPFTVFFAITDPESDFFLSVDNTTGAVLLERPGEPPLRTVAPDLATFLDSLQPAPAPAASLEADGD